MTQRKIPLSAWRVTTECQFLYEENIDINSIHEFMINKCPSIAIESQYSSFTVPLVNLNQLLGLLIENGLLSNFKEVRYPLSNSLPYREYMAHRIMQHNGLTRKYVEENTWHICRLRDNGGDRDQLIEIIDAVEAVYFGALRSYRLLRNLDPMVVTKFTLASEKPDGLLVVNPPKILNFADLPHIADEFQHLFDLEQMLQIS